MDKTSPQRGSGPVEGVMKKEVKKKRVTFDPNAKTYSGANPVVVLVMLAIYVFLQKRDLRRIIPRAPHFIATTHSIGKSFFSGRRRGFFGKNRYQGFGKIRYGQIRPHLAHGAKSA